MMVQALRDKQINTWAGLAKGRAAVVALVLMVCTMLLAHIVWFPTITYVTGIDLPEGLQQVVIAIAIAIQFFSGLGNIPVGMERAQKFMGKYTDESFSSGIYLLPRLPFPFITLLLVLWGSPLAKYFAGWMLEDDVYVNDQTMSVEILGLTSDGARIQLETTLVMRIAKAAVYLYQTKINTDEEKLLDSIRAQVTERIRQAIAQHEAKALFQGNLQGGKELAGAITEACEFVEDYGLLVAKVLHTHVQILNKQLEKAFDLAQGKSIFIAGASSWAETFAAFKAKLPAGTSEEAALIMFNAELLDANQQPVTLNMVKFK